MLRTLGLLFPLLVLSLAAAPGVGEEGSLRAWLSEIVTDAQQDWNLDGKVTPSDEFVEIAFGAGEAWELAGWRVWFNDTTPSRLELVGQAEPGGVRSWVNPPGEMNNVGHVALIDSAGRVVDEVRLGSAGVPSGAAGSIVDEALRRVDGQWRKGHATPGLPNGDASWRVNATWDPAAVSGWVRVGAVGRVGARVVHSDEAFVRLWAEVGPNASWQDVPDRNWSSGAPSRDAQGRLVATGSALSVAWFAESMDRTWAGPVHAWRVDGQAPEAARLPGLVWRPAAGGSWEPPAAVDDGVGGVQWEWTRAPEGGAPQVGNWSDAREVVVDWRVARNWTASARLRDGVGNEASVSGVLELRLDDQAPPPLRRLQAAGSGPVRVTWEAGEDDESGVASVVVRRVAGAREARWTLSGSAGSLEDPVVPGRDRVFYEAYAIDHAGNAGPTRHVEWDHPGVHPSAQQVRVAKAWWRAGRQEVRVDFDRPMNTTVAPQLFLSRGGPPP